MSAYGEKWAREYVERMARQHISGDPAFDSYVEEHGDDYEPDWEGGFEHAVREARRIVAELAAPSPSQEGEG